MITVAEAVKNIVKSSPILEEGMSRRLLNTSAVARLIAPKVSSYAKKEVSSGAVVMALKRLESSLPHHLTSEPLRMSTPDLIIRSSLIELTYRNSPALTRQQQALHSLISDHNEHLLIVTTGVFETTIIASSSLEHAVMRLLSGNHLIDSTTQLSSITVRLTPEMITATGSIARILRQLAWEDINLVEVVSTRQELTVIVHAEDADKAFATLHSGTM